MTIPKPHAWTASFPARLDTGMAGTSNTGTRIEPGDVRGGGGDGSGRQGGVEATGGGCSNPATDGVYVYVWDPLSKRVHKVNNALFLLLL